MVGPYDYEQYAQEMMQNMMQMLPYSSDYGTTGYDQQAFTEDYGGLPIAPENELQPATQLSNPDALAQQISQEADSVANAWAQAGSGTSGTTTPTGTGGNAPIQNPTANLGMGGVGGIQQALQGMFPQFNTGTNRTTGGMGGMYNPFFGMGGMGGGAGYNVTSRRDPNTGNLILEYSAAGGQGGGGTSGGGTVTGTGGGTGSTGQTAQQPATGSSSGTSGGAGGSQGGLLAPSGSIQTPWGTIEGLTRDQQSMLETILNNIGVDTSNGLGAGGGTGGNNTNMFADLLKSFADAQLEGKQANESRYNDILESYNALIGAMGNQGADIVGGYGERLRSAMDLLSTLGLSEKADINTFWDQESAKANQSLTDRGLGNTTIRDSVQQGIGSNRQSDLGRWWDRQGNRLVGTGLNASGDMLAAATGQQGFLANLAQQPLGVMERREDAYPSLTDMANLMLQIGAGGYAQGMGLPWQPELIPGGKAGELILKTG